MSSNQDIKLDIANTIDSNKRTYNIPDTFSGHQMIFNSDNLIFNSRLNLFFAFAKKDMYLSSDQNVHINAKKHIILNAEVLQLVKGSKQSAVLGDKLQRLLTKVLDDLSDVNQQLIDLKTHTHPVPALGMSGPPSAIPNFAAYQTIKMKYKNLKRNLKQSLSKIVKLK